MNDTVSPTVLVSPTRGPKEKVWWYVIWAQSWEDIVHLGGRWEAGVSFEDCAPCHEWESEVRMARQLGWSMILKTHPSVPSLSPITTHLLEVHSFTSARVWAHVHKAVGDISHLSYSNAQVEWISLSMYWLKFETGISVPVWLLTQEDTHHPSI